MSFLDMLGINKNDVLDFFKVLERQAAALERIAEAMEGIKQDTYEIADPRRIK